MIKSSSVLLPLPVEPIIPILLPFLIFSVRFFRTFGPFKLYLNVTFFNSNSLSNAKGVFILLFKFIIYIHFYIM